MHCLTKARLKCSAQTPDWAFTCCQYTASGTKMKWRRSRGNTFLSWALQSFYPEKIDSGINISKMTARWKGQGFFFFYFIVFLFSLFILYLTWTLPASHAFHAARMFWWPHYCGCRAAQSVSFKSLPCGYFLSLLTVSHTSCAHGGGSWSC